MRKTFILCTLVGSVSGFAQIGINTANPQGVFHIDAAKDNSATGVPTAAQQANDLVITAQGRVGIGTNTPINKLEVNSGTANASGITVTQVKNASLLATDSNGTIISGNTESAGVSVTKQRLAPASPSLILNTGSGAYSFRYSATSTGGYWQMRTNDGAQRQFNVWDTEYNGGTGGSQNTVYQGRNILTIAPNTWTSLNEANVAGGANEYNVYHIYDLNRGVIIRMTCTLSNVSGIMESMILEEF